MFRVWYLSLLDYLVIQLSNSLTIFGSGLFILFPPFLLPLIRRPP
jgi:hypothetical protein